MKGFLEAIDLGDSDEDPATEQDNDDSKQWSLLFHALSCFEKLFES
jgi:hypothetical protein